MDLITANRLQQLRKGCGLSQEALAQKLGISRQSISKWERAEAAPDIDNLIALSKIYGISVDELLGTDKEEKVEAKEIVAEAVQADNDDIPGKKSFKEKARSAYEKADNYGMYPEIAKAMFSLPFPLIIVAVYLALSFIFDIWHPLWLIFLTIPIYYRFAISCKAKNVKGMALLTPVPEIIVMLYLSFGFVSEAWGFLSFLFIIIPIYYWIVLMMKK